MKTPDVNSDDVVAQTQQWLEKAVIGLNFCPFAKSVYIKKQIRYVVSLAQTEEALLEALVFELQLLKSTPPDEIDTTLLIHPNVLNNFLIFNEFCHKAQWALEHLGLAGVIQIASFHPEYQFAGTEPDDITNFTNRAPYPILHLLREESVSKAVDSYPDVEGIPARNIETLMKLGLAGWQKLGIPQGPGRNH
jgi:hypothetical protein